MVPKMIYICSICVKTRPPLIVMTSEHREILDALVSESRHAVLRSTLLMICLDCNSNLETVAKFLKAAQVGLKHMIELVPKLESANNVNTDSSKAAQKEIQTKMKDKPFTRHFIGGNKKCVLKPYCTIIKRSQIPTNLPLYSEQNAFRCKGTSTALGVKKPETVVEQMEVSTTAQKESLREMFTKQEAVIEIESDSDTAESDVETKPTISSVREIEAENFAIEPRIECKSEPDSRPDIGPDIEDVPTSQLGLECQPNLELKPEPECNTESTDSCNSDQGNHEDLILAALAKTNTPIMPYLRSVSEAETNEINGNKKPISMTKTNRRKNKKKIQSQRVSAELDRVVHWNTEQIAEAEVKAEYNRLRQAPEFVKAKYKCSLCVTVCTDPGDMETHARTHYRTAGQYSCRFCWRRFRDEWACDTHIYTHLHRHVCMFCPFSTQDTELIVRHRCAEMSKDSAPTCADMTEQEPQTSVDMAEHGADTSRGMVKIEQSARTIAEATHRTEDENNFNIRDDMPCVFCSVVFANKYDLREHIERNHFQPARLEPVKTHKCNICNVKCKNLIELWRHKKEHKKLRAKQEMEELVNRDPTI